MRALWLIALVVLVACTETPRFLPDGYRDQSVQITSSTRFDAARFAGEWVIIESFDETPREVTADRVSFTPSPAGYVYATAISHARTDPALANVLHISDRPQLQIGQFGRLSYLGEYSDQDPIWVLWIDEDHRTAVLGTPSGRFGSIINRGTKLRADRLQAARDVLAFNGYDISKLRRVTR